MSDQNTPQLGDILPATHPSEEALKLLTLRRSTTANMMQEPGPDREQLKQILAIGARVPDHRRVVPYRFVIIEGDARHKLGNVLANVKEQSGEKLPPEQIELERNRFMRAPVIIMVVSSPNKEHKTPEWEQVLSCGAACQNILLATNAIGFAAQWLTEWYAYDEAVLEALEVKPEENIAGFIYLGTAKEDPKERPRVNAEEITSYW